MGKEVSRSSRSSRSSRTTTKRTDRRVDRPVQRQANKTSEKRVDRELERITNKPIENSRKVTSEKPSEKSIGKRVDRTAERVEEQVIEKGLDKVTPNKVEDKVETKKENEVKKEAEKKVEGKAEKQVPPVQESKHAKKKKLRLKEKPLIIILILVVITITLFLVATTFHKSDKVEETSNKTEEQTETKVEEPTPEPEVPEDFSDDYENPDVVGLIEFPGLDLKEPVLQSTNNSYYLNHDINKKKNVIGSTFLDYRVNIDNSPKILIFGHNSPNLNPPFKKLEKYYTEDFAKKNRIIKVTTKTQVRTFEIFSVYIDADELHNFSYMNVNFDSDADWANHIKQLKDNSWYDFGTEVSSSDKILVVQTCTYHSKYSKYKNKRFVLIAKQIS